MRREQEGKDGEQEGRGSRRARMGGGSRRARVEDGEGGSKLTIHCSCAE